MKKTRKLVVLAIALIMTLGMATTTTFAWLTTNTVAEVTPIELQVKASEGLMVSADPASGYRVVLPSSEITALSPVANVKLADLSMLYTTGRTMYDMKQLTGLAAGAPQYSTTNPTDTQTIQPYTRSAAAPAAGNATSAYAPGYYEFPLYFRYETPAAGNYAIKLSSLTVASASTASHATAWAQDTVAIGTDIHYSGVDLAKYFAGATVDEKIANIKAYLDESGNIYTSLTDDHATSDIIVVGVDSDNNQVVGSVTYGASGYEFVTTSDSNSIANNLQVLVKEGRPIASMAKDAIRVAFFESAYTGASGQTGVTVTTASFNYDPAAAAFSDSTVAARALKLIANPNVGQGFEKGIAVGADIQWDAYKYVWNTNATAPTLDTTPGKTPTTDYNVDLANMVLVNGSYIASVVVRIWMEGTDVDCFNAVLKDYIAASFNFMAVTATTPPSNP